MTTTVIEVCEAQVVTATSRRRLTKAIAQQFPIKRDWNYQFRDLPTPICRVRGVVLRNKAAWLYLIKDCLVGYVWVVPTRSAAHIASGGSTYTPDMCPAVIL